MNRWALLVAVLYVVIAVLLTLPFAAVAFAGGTVKLSDLMELFGEWQYWLLLGTMFVSQYALLRVPVRVASLRPVTQGALWPTLLAGGFMAGCLVTGGAWALIEWINGKFDSPGLIIGPPLGLLMWVIWAVVFYRSSRTMEPKAHIARQTTALIRGSILELLVAVPTHIVARHRNYCCAGILTFIGLTAGVSVMLFAFGPAVYFLFAERWRRLHPQRQDEPAA